MAISDLINLGIENKLIKFDDDNDPKVITYINQNKFRNYKNPEEKIQVQTFLKLILEYKYPVENIEMFVTVQMGVAKKEADIIVYDMVGRVIKSYKINPTNNELEIDVNEFAKGVYNIRIMNDSINQTKKLIVQ